jgi:phospholipid transport system substrate-binding protein
MRPIRLCRAVFPLIACFTFIHGATAVVLAGEATEQIRETTEKLISVLTDPAFQDPARAQEKKQLIRTIADERFDWEEAASRSLARHWVQRTDQEKREFVALFSDLLEATYMDKVDNYSGEHVLYVGENTDGDYGVVQVKIVTKTDAEIAVEYRVKRREDGWVVYDISVEGVSLINNYRTQFNSIILKSSYQDLVKRLKAKLAKK